MTSWAVLALCLLVGAGHGAVQRGALWLALNQSAAGAFPREAVNGVFFGTAMLDYDLYRAYFPAWALAMVAAEIARGADEKTNSETRSAIAAP